MVTGGQTPGTAQLAATASIRPTPELRSKITSSPVSMSIAVDAAARGPASRGVGSRCGDHVTAHRLGDGVSRHRDRADPLQLLRFVEFGVGHRGEEQFGDVVDVDTGVDFAADSGDSAGRTAPSSGTPLPS